MTTTLERLSSARGEGNVWRRIGALVIDWAIIGVALCVVATIGYGLTGGQIRMAQPPLAFTNCLPADAPPANFDPAAPLPGVSEQAQRDVMGDPSTFRADVVTDCRTLLMGSEVDRMAHIQENASTQRFYILPVDADFEVTRPGVYLDHYYVLTMLLVLSLLEGITGATLGKRVTGLRVQSRHGRSAGLGRALVRNLILWGPGAALGLVGAAASQNLFLFGDLTGAAMGMAGLLIAFALWPFVLLMGLLASNARPFWDQIAGVRVVRA